MLVPLSLCILSIVSSILQLRYYVSYEYSKTMWLNVIHLSTFYITARSDRGLPYSTPLFPPEDILFWTIATCQYHFWILSYSFQKLDVMTSLQIWFCFPCFFSFVFLVRVLYTISSMLISCRSINISVGMYFSINCYYFSCFSISIT